MNKHITSLDNVKNIVMIVGLHLIFFLMSWLIIKNTNFILSIPIIIIFSLIHQKFIGEFLHEGSHYHLNNKRYLNDLISNYLVGLFFFVTVKNYRKKHFTHHEFSKYFDDEDPETGPLKIYSKKDFWKNIFYDLIGINGLIFLINYTNQDSKSRSSKYKSKNNLVLDKSLFILILIQSILLLISFYYNFIIYYLIYYFTLGTLYHFQLRFRILGQHVFLKPGKKINYNISTSRTIKGGLLEKLFFTSDITAYHDLHHRYPHLPYRKCRKLFLENTPTENINIYTTKRSNLIVNFYRSLI